MHDTVQYTDKVVHSKWQQSEPMSKVALSIQKVLWLWTGGAARGTKDSASPIYLECYMSVCALLTVRNQNKTSKAMLLYPWWHNKYTITKRSLRVELNPSLLSESRKIPTTRDYTGLDNVSVRARKWNTMHWLERRFAVATHSCRKHATHC